MKDLSQDSQQQDTTYPQPKLMWSPDPAKWTHIHDFRKLINDKFHVQLENYHDLHRWTCDNYPEFWQEFWSYSKIIHSKDFDQVVDRRKAIDDIPEWFAGSRLNYAENMLRFRGDKIALYATGEGRQTIESRTFDQLRDRVAEYAAAMKSLGIVKGDRVVGYIPNCIEAIEAMLATASIGAIWSSTSPDFGSTGVLERFSQIQPKLILSVPGVVYNGRCHSHLEKLQQVVMGLPFLERVVLIPFDGDDPKMNNISSISKSIWLRDFLLLGRTADNCVPPLEFEQVPFNHPLFIMYSSGTTGVPKCIVHSQGGTLIQHLKEHMMQGNLTPEDTIIYYTTAGWMMWNWLVTALAVGATVVLYDGSPLVPTANVLWDLVDQLGITILGTGAKYLAVLEERGIRPKETHRLDTLHTILSTGSPLKPHSYDYVYEHVKKDVILGSISGGTDIIGCFMGQNHTVPVYRGEIQSCHLAMAMECWVDQDKPVVGQSGELVCTKPHPSMPISFWNDQDGSKYRKAYFASYRGVWCHGDFCCINPVTKGLVMLGRSDGTLNPNGVRFGSAEIYNIVEAFKEVEDSLCVAQRNSSAEERVILFVKMVPGMSFSDELVRSLQMSIRAQLSTRHVPAIITETKEIPYTISGKKVEVAVRDIIAGRDVKYRGAISNPNCLDAYRDMPVLDGF